MKSGRLSNGFSLIELLVVIAIIAILAAILFPIFTNAREQGKKAGCASNMRQIGSAFSMYVDDNNSRYPAGALWCPGSRGLAPEQFPDWITWDVAIYKYVKNSKIFKCPSDHIKRPVRVVNGWTLKTPRTYALNDQPLLDWMLDEKSNPNPNLTWTEGEMKSPSSRYVLLGEWPRDVNSQTGEVLGYNYLGFPEYQSLAGNGEPLDGAHMANTTCNYLFFDGHVVCAAPAKMTPWKWWSFLPGRGSSNWPQD